MAKRRKKTLSPEEKKRRELRSYLDQLSRIKQPTQQDMDLMSELNRALRSMTDPTKRR